MDRKKNFLFISPLLLCAVLVGCSHGAYSRAAIGQLTLSLRAQSLGGARRAVLELAGMRLQRAGAGPLIYNFRPPHVVMLADDGKGDDDLLLNRQTLPAGTYTGVTLMLDPAQGGVDSFAELPDGRLQVLKSRADQEELTVEQSFSVPASGRRMVVLALNLRKGAKHEPTHAERVLIPELGLEIAYVRHMSAEGHRAS